MLLFQMFIDREVEIGRFDMVLFFTALLYNLNILTPMSQMFRKYE